MKDVSFFLQTKLPTLDLNSLAGTIMPFLKKKNYSHYPVIKDGYWFGNILTEDLYTIKSSDKISNLQYNSFTFFYAEPNLQWPIVWNLFIQNNCNILPVIDRDKKLFGIYLKEDFAKLWNDIPTFTEKGTTIILEKEIIHYSFSQISQIVEQNNAKVLGIIIIEFNNDNVTLMLRTNTINTSSILNELRRFDYKIISNHIEDDHFNQIKENSDYLNKYLNI